MTLQQRQREAIEEWGIMIGKKSTQREQEVILCFLIEKAYKKAYDQLREEIGNWDDAKQKWQEEERERLYNEIIQAIKYGDLREGNTENCIKQIFKK